MNEKIQNDYTNLVPLKRDEETTMGCGCTKSSSCCGRKKGCCATKFKQGGCCSDNYFSAKGCGKSDKQCNVFDYLADLPRNPRTQEIVEVQFKNTRKAYYQNNNGLSLEKGDVVVVESVPGHDVGTVTLTGPLVYLQLQKRNAKTREDIKRIYRKATPVDMERFEAAKSLEQETMIRTRQIALNLGLEMKISDVEYQADGLKAIFYYIADRRVDFRQLIKVLAETFQVRIEMKQIGARQEAGRVGGIGPCGRELCCTTWMGNFSSVSTQMARQQDLSLNPQHLAGQCAKLKCCLNFELNTYIEASQKLPAREIELETLNGTFYFFKADILAGLVTYSSDPRMLANLTVITAKRAFEIIEQNKQGQKPQSLLEEGTAPKESSHDLLEQESLTRFDGLKKKKRKPFKDRNNDRRKNFRNKREETVN